MKIIHRFTKDEMSELRRRRLLIDHYQSMLNLLDEDFARIVGAMSHTDLSSGNFELDMDKKVLTNADDNKPQ